MSRGARNGRSIISTEAILRTLTSIIANMDARADCKLPHHLSTISVSLLMGNDAIGLRALIKDLM
jgi:hypothetical protein